MKTIFRRLVRFKDPSGAIYFGESPSEKINVGDKVLRYQGEDPWSLSRTDEVVEVSEILCPLSSTPIIYGIGLNYRSHVIEAGLSVPEHPTVFTKPPDALNGPCSDILVDKECLNADYEGEFCFVIGKDAHNVGENENALDYVLGYTTGNDVSSRYWQMPERSGQQHGYSKSFDGFAPLGPMIVSTEIIPDVSSLVLTTRVNGEERQRGSISDLVFKVQDCIKHLSRGTTLRRGTVVMTGTPSGVGALMKPPNWLKDGDVVEVEITQVGTIKNRYELSQ